MWAERTNNSDLRSVDLYRCSTSYKYRRIVLFLLLFLFLDINVQICPPKGGRWTFFFFSNFFILFHVEYFGSAMYVLAYLKKHACRFVVLIERLSYFTLVQLQYYLEVL